MPLLPVRKRSASTARNGSLPMSAALTKRCVPFSTLVITTAARRAARSAFNAVRISRFMISRGRRTDSLDLLHIDPDRAAARQADLPGRLVGDAEFKHFRFAAFDHIERLGNHGAFDAAAGYRAEEIALAVDDQVRPDRTRRRAPSLNYGRERNLAPARAPL